MNRFYYITIAALAAVLYLQARYINSLYSDYINQTSDNIDKQLHIAINRELSYRNYKKNSSLQEKPWKEKLYYKRMEDMTPHERDSLLKIAPLDNIINIDSARNLGIGATTGDIYNQLNQDYTLQKGSSLNLKILDSLFVSSLTKHFPHKIQLYNKDTLTIDSIDYLNIDKPEYTSGILPIGTKGLQYLQLTASIPINDFIRHQFITLILTACLIGIVLLCLLYQLTEIRLKNNLLLKREISVNGVIHDLKSPLNSVITLLGWFKTTETNLQKKELFKEGQVNLKHLVNNIDSLLVAARGDRRKIILNKTGVDLVQIVELVRKELSGLYPSKTFTLTVDNQLPDHLLLRADAMYIENVIRNLIENALKYSDDGVAIAVILKESEKSLMVSVTDNGWGIAQRFQKKLFSQFYQVPRKDRSRKGYGIGLAQAKNIINEHGGYIKVESEENLGSIFTFTIPLS